MCSMFEGNYLSPLHNFISFLANSVFSSTGTSAFSKMHALLQAKYKNVWDKSIMGVCRLLFSPFQTLFFLVFSIPIPANSSSANAVRAPVFCHGLKFVCTQ